jgi:hypothetical protein
MGTLFAFKRIVPTNGMKIKTTLGMRGLMVGKLAGVCKKRQWTQAICSSGPCIWGQVTQKSSPRIKYNRMEQPICWPARSLPSYEELLTAIPSEENGLRLEK